MNMSRREVLAGFGSMAALNATLGARSHALPFMADSPGGAAPLPAKQDFSIPEGVTYLNSAYTHPIPTAGLEALRDYGDRRARPEAVSKPLQKKPVDIKAEFASLINAKKAESASYPTQVPEKTWLSTDWIFPAPGETSSQMSCILKVRSCIPKPFNRSAHSIFAW